MADAYPHWSGQREPFDYTNGEQVAAQQNAAGLREQRLRAFEAQILSQQDGREWLWALVASMHWNELRIAATGSDYENGIWAGESHVAAKLMRRFASASPLHYAQMFKEHDGPIS